MAFATERPLGFPTGAVPVEQWEQELLQRERIECEGDGESQWRLSFKAV